MKPYYERCGITIYHGDCREILPELPKVDLVLTDPPYGIADLWDRQQVGKGGASRLWDGNNDWDKETCQDLVDMAVNKGDRAIVWGGNYYQLKPSRGYLIWDKMQTFSNADSEMAWCSWAQTPRTFRYARCQLANEGKVHPTQKPLRLLTWCLSFCPDAQTILDPFMGSGTTLVAAKMLNRKAIGIEIEERYCEIAALRLAQDNLFQETS